MSTFNKLKILPTTIYEFQLPDDCWEKLIEKIRKINPESLHRRDDKPHYGFSGSGIASLHRESEWHFLIDYIEKKLEEVKADIGFETIEKLKVSLMWANKSEMFEWHHAHEHPWSIISGIIYIQGFAGKTWFSRKSEYGLDFPVPLHISNAEEKQNIYKHEFKERTMVLFPSSLRHSVDENSTSLPRITISFNTFPAGSVGDVEKLAGIYLDVL